MRTLRILFAKELNATLTSPIGYTVAAVFLLVLGYTFSLTLFVTKVANLQYIFHQMYVLSILLVPVLTMRAFAEERRSDTLELLLTAPVREVCGRAGEVCRHAGARARHIRADAGLRRYSRSLWRAGLGTDLCRLSRAGAACLAAGRRSAC